MLIYAVVTTSTLRESLWSYVISVSRRSPSAWKNLFNICSSEGLPATMFFAFVCLKKSLFLPSLKISLLRVEFEAGCFWRSAFKPSLRRIRTCIVPREISVVTFIFDYLYLICFLKNPFFLGLFPTNLRVMCVRAVGFLHILVPDVHRAPWVCRFRVSITFKHAFKCFPVFLSSFLRGLQLCGFQAWRCPRES